MLVVLCHVELRPTVSGTSIDVPEECIYQLIVFLLVRVALQTMHPALDSRRGMCLRGCKEVLEPAAPVIVRGPSCIYGCTPPGAHTTS